MVDISLTKAERFTLFKLAKKTKIAKTAIKYRVILAIDAKKLEQKEIAEAFLLDEKTIINWKKDFLNRENSSDFESWTLDSYPGDKGNLSQLQLQEINKYVIDNDITDSLQISQFISQNFGINYSKNGVIKILHKLDFEYKNTKLIPAKADIEEQKKAWEEITNLIDNLTENEKLGFMDAMHPIHNSKNQKCWIKKGTQKFIKSNTGRNRLNINGIVDLHSENLDITTDFADSINAQNTIKLFDKLQAKALQNNPNLTTYWLISDNAKYYKNQLITEHLANPKCIIKLKFLPAYSPNLNLIERLWHYLRKKVIGIKFRETFAEFKADISEFFENGYKSVADKIKKFIGLQPHFFET